MCFLSNVSSYPRIAAFSTTLIAKNWNPIQWPCNYRFAFYNILFYCRLAFVFHFLRDFNIVLCHILDFSSERFWCPLRDIFKSFLIIFSIQIFRNISFIYFTYMEQICEKKIWKINGKKWFKTFLSYYYYKSFISHLKIIQELLKNHLNAI